MAAAGGRILGGMTRYAKGAAAVAVILAVVILAGCEEANGKKPKKPPAETHGHTR